MAATIENPESLAQWWSYIQTDSTPLKVRYFFRNQSAIRSACIVDSRWTTLEEMLAFLGEQVALKCHRQYDYAPCGVYSMRERDGETEQFEATFRIDPSTPSARGPLHGGTPHASRAHAASPAIAGVVHPTCLSGNASSG